MSSSRQTNNFQDASAQQMRGAHAAPKRKGKRPAVIALSVLLVVLIAVGVGGFANVAWQQGEMDRAAQQQANTPEPATPEQVQPAQPEDSRVQNPINFAELKEQNPEVYAWIYVPGTDVNLPVVQSTTDDNFYLNHNIDGDYAVEGAIYSQSMNAADFSDPVTVLYGHNLVNGSMFSTLHYFENEDFFAQHDTMYIYTIGHILTYKVVSAYQYDDRHILNSFDFSDPSVVRTYFDYVMAPNSLVENVRQGVTLQTTDKIVQLSTCTDTVNHTDTRYLVTGVLTDDQPTY